MEWISSEGGPLLLLPETHLMSWTGFKSRKRAPTDYERACGIDDYIGVIDVGSGKGLVLGDEPMQTAWMAHHGIPGGQLIRWMYADSETEILNSLPNAPDSVFHPSTLSYPVTSPACVLFDSALPGNAINAQNSLRIVLIPGVYSVSTGRYDADKSTAVVLHRLLLSGKQR